VPRPTGTASSGAADLGLPAQTYPLYVRPLARSATGRNRSGRRPRNRVATTAELQAAGYASHLVVIGGSDFTMLTHDMFSALHLPVKMSPRFPETDWLGLEVGTGEETQRFSPVLSEEYGTRVLHEDVILFVRGVNPADRRRTITICAGIHARGTLAAARCLTDPVLGPGNQAYLRRKAGANLHFGFVARAIVIDRSVAPPDLSDPEHRLYEWTQPE
jgi:hypothetical protein